MLKTEKPKTHFEQVPLEIVKRIAEEQIPYDEANGVDVTVEPPARKRVVFPALGSATVNAR